MNFKIAFTDIDGTLLNKDRVPSESTIKQVNRLTEKDIPFILISSRMPSAMFHIQEDLGIKNTPLICYNGGLVLVNGKSIHSTEIPMNIIEKIANFNSGKKFHISLYNQDNWYVESMDFWALREENNTKVSPSVKPIKEVIKDWTLQKKGAHKIMCMGEKEALDKLVSDLNLSFSDELHLYRSKDTYLEIANKEISKLTGIRALLNHQYPDFSLLDCVAFGDNFNDMEMLSAVGIGIAVKNAKKEVLAIASVIVEKNHEDGVAKWLKEKLDSYDERLLKMSEKYRDNGAIGALLDEYEKAVVALQNVIGSVSKAELHKIVDKETKDPDCISIQTILTHVVRAGYGYVVSIRKHLGEEIDYFSSKKLETIPEYQAALTEMFAFNEKLFLDYPDLKLEEYDTSKKMKVSWGQYYDVEQIMEHAIVHILRHRRQIERFLLKI